MIKQASFVFYLWVIGGLAACSLPASMIPTTSNQDISVQYETVSVMLTATAAFENSKTMTPSMLPTVTTREPRATDTQIPTIHQTVFVVESTSAAEEPITAVAESKPCDLAQPGRPIDVTVPDDTRFEAGEYFSKT